MVLIEPEENQETNADVINPRKLRNPSSSTVTKTTDSSDDSTAAASATVNEDASDGFETASEGDVSDHEDGDAEEAKREPEDQQQRQQDEPSDDSSGDELKQRKYEDAIKECTKALELNPTYMKALVGRGEAHEKLEHFEGAISGNLDVAASTSADKSNRLSAEAYKHAAPATANREFTFPFIQISTKRILTVESHHSGLTPLEVAQLYLYRDLHPSNQLKDVFFYQQILLESGSVLIEPTRRGNEWAYSKLIIKKILSSKDWGLAGPLAFKQLRNYGYLPKQYNYFDYMDAWENALIYNNKARKFSWWIQFQLEKDPSTFKFPSWFLNWFWYWGIIPFCMPINVVDVFEKFKTHNQGIKNLIIMFVAYYQIPWIVKWDYDVCVLAQKKFYLEESFSFLCREIFVKWWDKFQFFDVNGIFNSRNVISIPGNTIPVKRQSPENLVELLKDLLKGNSRDDIKRKLFEALDGTESSVSVSTPIQIMDSDEYNLLHGKAAVDFGF